MSFSPIAQQQKQINKVLLQSKQRLKYVQQKIQLLSKQYQSIEQDIELLTSKKVYEMEMLERKEKVYQSVNGFVKEAEMSYNKLVESTQALLGAFVKESKKMEDAIKKTNVD